MVSLQQSQAWVSSHRQVLSPCPGRAEATHKRDAPTSHKDSQCVPTADSGAGTLPRTAR